MRDTTTQWFILNKPYVNKTNILIDDEIAHAEDVVKKLKSQKRAGYSVKTRERRIKTAAGIPMKIADATNNKVIGYEIPENENGTLTRKKIGEIYTYLLSYGYKPEFGCLREHITKGVCSI